MNVTIIETTELGDRSYLVVTRASPSSSTPNATSTASSPWLAEQGVRISHVLETHIHDDYVAGGLELSRTMGAEYVVAAGEDVSYEPRAVTDGDVIDAAPIQLQVMTTPGHTHHHVSYVLRDASGAEVGVFTGGSMLFGTTGRTDLIGRITRKS